MRYDVLREPSDEWLGWVEAETLDEAWDLATKAAHDRELSYPIDVREPACDPDEYEEHDEFV
jgi:hypothetical protein